MGIGGISPVQLIIILVIVLLIFGTKKLRNLGGDLGGAIKGFKKAVKEEHTKQENTEQLEDAEQGFGNDSGDDTEQTVVSKKKDANKDEKHTEKEI